MSEEIDLEKPIDSSKSMMTSILKMEIETNF